MQTVDNLNENLKNRMNILYTKLWSQRQRQFFVGARTRDNMR